MNCISFLCVEIQYKVIQNIKLHCCLLFLVLAGVGWILQYDKFVPSFVEFRSSLVGFRLNLSCNLRLHLATFELTLDIQLEPLLVNSREVKLIIRPASVQSCDWARAKCFSSQVLKRFPHLNDMLGKTFLVTLSLMGARGGGQSKLVPISLILIFSHLIWVK